MESYFKYPLVNLPVFFVKDVELSTHDMDDTNLQETLTQDNVLLRHICKILNTNF